MTELRRVVLIAATARSGSTLLGAALGATGRAGNPVEHLNVTVMDDARPRWGVPVLTVRGHLGRARRRLRGISNWRDSARYRPASVATYLDHLAEHETGPDGVLSAKVMWLQWQMVVLQAGLDTDHWGVPVTWIRISRTDRLRQAISTERAVQTGQWTAARPTPRATPTYDRERIARRIDSIGRVEAGWDRYFADRSLTPLHLTYEDLDADYEGTIATVLAHLGIDAAVPPRQLERQGDGTNEEWRQRFLAEHGEPETASSHRGMTPLPLPATAVDPAGVEELERLLDLVRVGLGLDVRHAPGEITTDDVRAALAHGVVDLVDRAVPTVGAAGDAQDLLERVRRHDAFASLRLRALTRQLLDALQTAGVEAVVLKGVALAAQTGRRSTERPGSDVDLLVRPEDWPAAHACLGAAGMMLGSITPPPTPGTRTQFVQFAGYEAVYRGFDTDLDLHWRIGPGHDAELAASQLLVRCVTVDAGDTSLPTLHPDDALAQTWLHGAKDHWVRLRSTTDAHLLITVAGADPVRAAALLGHSSAAVEGPVALALLHGASTGEDRRRSAAAARWVRGAVERPQPDEHDRPADGYVAAVRSRIALSPNPATATSVVAQLTVPTWSLARSRLPARWWLLAVAARPFRILTRLAGQVRHRRSRVLNRSEPESAPTRG